MQEFATNAWSIVRVLSGSASQIEVGVSKAKSLNNGHGDNCGTGGPSYNVEILREMLKQGLSNIAVTPLWDKAPV